MAVPEPALRSALPPQVAVCGLSCRACAVYLASRDGSDRLARLAEKLGHGVEETRCDGCRAERRSRHCRACSLAACAMERGQAVCGTCPDFPCPAYEAFRGALPHRREVLTDMADLLMRGPEVWLARMDARYACGACGEPNSAYDLSCRSCGHQPGSPFAETHAEVLKAHLPRTAPARGTEHP